MQCISIPECTQRLKSSHYIRRATWPRKRRRRRRRRAQWRRLRRRPARSPRRRSKFASLKNCRRLDAGTSHEPRIKIWRLWSTKRGCRRDIRSNGWIVFRKEFAPSNRSGRRNEFSSFGAGLPKRSAISPGPKPGVRSGPDVFADALVPRNFHVPRSPCSDSPHIRRLALTFPISFLIVRGRQPTWDAGRFIRLVVPRGCGVSSTPRTPDQ